ncbi:hypothetical protein SPRG_10385 [Saprolegnia parasitica CBS 223.65]|uniref:Uncharacterized protein n=1 Tax=Saprolegnia parasitica (strain CBS 223.65) TaxID=695850 RepID=A0A067C594_SAPPC|nr:hypothetical protein SPRG_10385 [Saprolegnia parasitica CBS 223.65]KDO24310.1 hypothetical protein SPRG_10385 [Saprolegnia parasitica CBS 223.65]|eukprot:XP_012204907.1 hypothetical protein SPRG_10385 [Saprolegnia parasitica CBS 223.65]
MPEKALNKDLAIKAFWTLVIKQDVPGVDAIVTQYPHFLPPDLRYPPMLHCTGLHVAVQKNNEPLAALFLRLGVHINAQNKAGATPLHLACRLGFASMVRYLLRHGADYAVLDAQMHSPFEVATWSVLQDALLSPLQTQAAALLASEACAREDAARLQSEISRTTTALEGLYMEWDDIQSQGLEELAAYRAQSDIEDALRLELIELRRTLQHCDADRATKTEQGAEQHAQLEDVLGRYRIALDCAASAAIELQHQQDVLATAYSVKSAKWAIYSDKLGVVDAMANAPNDIDVQLWGANLLSHLAHDPQTPHELLVKQNMLRTVRDTMERFPFHAKIQEHAMEAIGALCDALPTACELCMQERFIENIQAAQRQFTPDDAFASHCVYALRALFMPRTPSPHPVSQVHLKFMCKFCADDNAFVVDLLAKCRSSKLVLYHDALPDLAGLLFVLAKYNARQVFLERDALGLRTVLDILVHVSVDEETVRNLLGIASLLSLADVRCPEEDTLPPCYISFGLPKVIPLLQKYAGNPDVVMWGIRFLRNLAERNVVAKDQVSRSGIEHILTDLIAACASTSMRISILQLIHVAFVTNYDRLNQVEELSSMVLDGVRDCFLTHQNSVTLQEWALKSLVVACKHPSNLTYLMASRDDLEACLMDILTPLARQAPDAFDARRFNALMLWGLRFLLVYYEYEGSVGTSLHDLANSHDACSVLFAVDSFCDKHREPTTATIANLVTVLRKVVQCTCRQRSVQ